MRKLLAAAVSLAAIIGAEATAPASAADMAVKAVPPAPLPVIYNWSGFYIGGNGGWGSSRNCWDFVTAAGLVVADACSDRSGGLIGGQIGYRWQTGGWVFGLEAQGDWADLSNTRLSLIDQRFSTRVRTDGIGLFTGQVGYAWNAALFYVKGGAAVTSNSYDILTTIDGLSVASANSTRWGGAVGVGFEYGFTPNWSVGLEYDHLFMGDANNSFSVANPIVAGALNRINQDVDMVTLRINYRFGGYGAPIAARY
ncbi:outer membrane protein [Bradyrhizobium sp.]|uniref:outer membrane protein n=1 Tax=Bradyrhizobium sp. TaxID=376 RepID=UPI002BC86C45|nr:outer membrane beta-barrel protein [Bradyrhizobium sp.]HMM88550.1 outer membrane beta-barrel protein [Bradyrhizobium sp.]